MEETWWGRLRPNQLFTALDPTWESGRERLARRGCAMEIFHLINDNPGVEGVWGSRGGQRHDCKGGERHYGTHRITVWTINLLRVTGKLLWLRIPNGDHISSDSSMGISVCFSQRKAALARNAAQRGRVGWIGVSVCIGWWITVPHDRHPSLKQIRLYLFWVVRCL